MKTMQQEFDAVVAHLYQQGKPSMADIPMEGVICAYRGDNGTMCAVGCRIPDNMYDPEMEGNSLFGIIGYELPQEISEYSDMFEKLQDVHDLCDRTAQDNFHKTDLKVRLKRVANQFKINFTIPSEIV